MVARATVKRQMRSPGTPPLLDIGRLSVALGPRGRRVTVVDDVSLSLQAGHVLCVVGESSSGKSVTALAGM